MTTLQFLGVLMLGGVGGFMACALLQMNREQPEGGKRKSLDAEFDTMRLDHLILNTRSIVCTKVNDRSWWSVVPNDTNKSTATALDLRDAIDSDMDYASEFPAGAETAENG